MSAAILALLGSPALAIERDDVIEAAAAYAEHQWVMGEANQTADCTTGYTSDFATDEVVEGVAYAWGGWMSTAEYDRRLADGDAAGSHSWHGVLSCAAGVDCSGFVSQVWGTDQKYSTSTLYLITEEIDVSEIQPGDAFNKAGSHVVLYVGTDDSGEPLFYEAAGGASRVRLHSGWSYLEGYTPVRYVNIEDSAPEPIVETEPVEEADAAGGERSAADGSASADADDVDGDDADGGAADAPSTAPRVVIPAPSSSAPAAGGTPGAGCPLVGRAMGLCG